MQMPVLFHIHVILHIISNVEVSTVTVNKKLLKVIYLFIYLFFTHLNPSLRLRVGFVAADRGLFTPLHHSTLLSEAAPPPGPNRFLMARWHKRGPLQTSRTQWRRLIKKTTIPPPLHHTNTIDSCKYKPRQTFLCNKHIYVLIVWRSRVYKANLHVKSLYL